MKTAFRTGHSGFTLIELMICIVILSIAMALALPNYRIWLQNTHIRNATESIRNGIQRARAEAIKDNTNVTFTLTPVADPNAFWTITSAAGIIETHPAGEISQGLVIVAQPAGATAITFSNMGTVVAAPAPGALTQIDIDNGLPAADSRELRITIGAGGNVRVCDPDPGVAVSDPRYCGP